jgi:hypothetical protein
MIPVHELDSETAAAIASIEVREEFEGQGGHGGSNGYIASLGMCRADTKPREP